MSMIPGPDLNAEKSACLRVLADVARLQREPTPQEFEAFLDSVNTFKPLPPGETPETLLSQPANFSASVSQIHTAELQQQVYRCAHYILRSQGIDPQEAAVLATLRSVFQLDQAVAATLTKQPIRGNSANLVANSALSGMASLIRREGDIRQLIFDYAMGAAIVGLIPLTGGGTLEVKLLAVLLLNLKMMWDIRHLWGQPQGQGALAALGNIFGALGAIIAGFLAWGTLVGLGVIFPYLGAFAKAAGFATATWVVGQATNQFYTSAKHPDLRALKRAFPSLMPLDQ